VCFNGGERVIHDSIPSCKCADGFTGTLCQTRFFNLGFSGTPAAFLALIAFNVLLVGGVFSNKRKSKINRSRRNLADQKYANFKFKKDLKVFV